VNLTRIPKEDHIPTEQVAATELERVIVYIGPTQKRNIPLYNCGIQKELLIPCKEETEISALIKQNPVLNMV
jgi:hypothetical protein